MKRFTFALTALAFVGCATAPKPAPRSTSSSESLTSADKKKLRIGIHNVIHNEIRTELSTLQALRAASHPEARMPATTRERIHSTNGTETNSETLAERIEAARPAPRKTATATSVTTAATEPAESASLREPPARSTKPARVPVLVNPEFQTGEIATAPEAEVTVLPAGPLKRLKTFEASDVRISSKGNTPLIFELPVTYNDRVKAWINYFQTEGRQSFRRWLERSTRYLPYVQSELDAANMPQDLIYVAMIESGFAPSAVSPAQAVGMWQFIRPTGNRYGLRTTWWLDERRDVYKSTKAAVAYMRDLYKMFGSWYLVAASYNMGENGVKRLIKKHDSNDFWELADRNALPEETKNYVPKILAAMLIAKAPGLYGFRDLQFHLPHSYDYSVVPGGTRLTHLAAYLGVSGKYLQDLNPELIRGYVPPEISGHRIRIPKGSTSIVAQYVQMRDSGTSARALDLDVNSTFN